MVYPEHIQIETIAGACTAKCSMCPLTKEPRPLQVMGLREFEIILGKLRGLETQKFMTLHGLGEPLLDRELPVKIALAKKYGFRGLGFATNATELDETLANDLLDSGLDTIICSIDGVTRETHEQIRAGTSFERVVANVERFILLRNRRESGTRVLIRFINQPLNHSEWEAYLEYWNGRIDPARRDGILRIDIHNWGGNEAVESIGGTTGDGLPWHCDDITTRLIIHATGTLSFCCGDFRDYFHLGNALDDDPIELYNRPPFTTYREAMRKGELRKFPPCSTCDILFNRQKRIATTT